MKVKQKEEKEESQEELKQREKAQEENGQKQEEETDVPYEAWFASIWQIRGKKKKRLQEMLGSGREVYHLKRELLDKLNILTDREKEILWKAREALCPKKAWEKLKKEQVSFLPYHAAEFPERLRRIEDGPYGIYFKGRLPKEGQKTAAIVGARQCSRYGERFALEYGKVLGKAGVQIISGMARGIDGAAQRGAIIGEGYSCGVLGSGVDICYPRENRGLYADLAETGGLLSEYPLEERPRPEFFPRRNRLISGLSDVTIIIEAREKSGSFITADFALEQGKDVYALPGPADSTLSRGCHRLIAQGAGILLSPKDLLRELGMTEATSCDFEKTEKVLEKETDIVYSCVDLSPKSLHQLAEETKLTGKVLMERLITLELMGHIEEVSKNYYRRV
ncbi:DNA-processing protein DprA [Suipraeoptans intestinalis]